MDQQLHELEEADFSELASFLALIFGQSAQHHDICLRHWSTQNPAWEANIPRGWLLRSSTGKLIAFTSNIAFNYVVEGAPSLGCATGTTAVHPDYRGQGLSKIVGRAFLEQRHRALLLAIDSTGPAHRMWRSLGMSDLPRAWPNYRLIGNPAAFGARFADRLPEPIRAIAGAAIAAPLRLLKRRQPVTGPAVAAQIFGFTAADDPALQRCAPLGATTYAVRNAAILNWCFFGTQHLRTTRAVFEARHRSELVGYLAIKRTPSNTYFLMECCCRNDDPAIAHALLASAVEFSERQKIPFIMVSAYSDVIAQAASKFATLPVNIPALPTYCYSAREALTLSTWRATPGDGGPLVD